MIWWGKVIAKLFLSRLPLGYRVWQKVGLFRHGNMDKSEYAIRVFNAHVASTGLSDKLRGMSILELGPGDSIATAIIAASYGAKAILVDSGNFIRMDIEPYLRLQSVLAGLGASPPDITNCKTVADILDRCGAKYMSEGLRSLKKIESESIDFVFSQAVLEHVRINDFLPTIEETRRVLRAAGICSHRVDLKDHLGGALNNLRFSTPIWESNFFSQSGFYTNRIRFRQMLELFGKAGFEVEVTNANRWNMLPTEKRYMAREFQLYPEEDLCVNGFDVLLRK